MLHQNEEYDYDNDFENALSTTHSLYQDSEEEVSVTEMKLINLLIFQRLLLCNEL
jgi:hypothetical protein